MKKRICGRNRNRITGFLFFFSTVLIFALTVGQGTASAVAVSQLNITGGSVNLNFDHLGSIRGNFTDDGVLVMGTFQPPPDIFPALHIDGHTLSIFTSSAGGVLPAPTGEVNGTAITADLSSLFVGVSGPLINGQLNIGGMASGTYDPATGAFTLRWTHVYETLGWHDITFGGKWKGDADIAPVPLPAAVWFFGAGLLSLAGLFREKRSNVVFA